MEWTPDEIKRFKSRHGLTGDSMAATLGVTRSYVFQLMNGRKAPSETIKRLLECLDKNMGTKKRKEEKHVKAQRNLPKR